MNRRLPAAVVLSSILLFAAACDAPVRQPPAPTSVAASPTSSATPTVTPSPAATSAADRALARLDLRGRAGQLVMTGYLSGDDVAPTVAALRSGVGNVFLGGRFDSGAAPVAAVTGSLQGAAPNAVPLLVGTDQEGGEIQVLRGDGFDEMPSGLQQGALDPTALQAAAARWGAQLRAAGVNTDLAPVLDTVAAGADNPPIGYYDRQFGSDPAAVAAHGAAFATGLRTAGVAAAGKHFPGLGRVTLNTDLHLGVTDGTTGDSDADLQPFTAAIAAGIPMVMVSSAIYPRLDGTSIAAFSPTVVTGLLRQRLGFGGVVVSDDVGRAGAVSDTDVGARAVRFVAAGGDLVLDVLVAQAPTLVDALVAAARSDPAFAARVDESARRVLRLKADLGLLG